MEKEARLSLLSLAPTVIASTVRAGDVLHAVTFALPAAMTKTTPRPIALRTAVSSEVLAEPPRLILATAGRTRFWATQLMPAMTPEVLPDPVQPSTRTACRVTPLATPKVEPPTVPATWVP